MHTLDSPLGVQRMSISRGLFLVGAGGAYLPPPDADYDFMLGFEISTAGEPYDSPLIKPLLEEQAKYHSSYYLLFGDFGFARRAPSPVFFAHGFTDDVFWADQVLLYYNKLRSLYPDAPIQVLLGDIGHQRAQSKPADPH